MWQASLHPTDNSQADLLYIVMDLMSHMHKVMCNKATNKDEIIRNFGSADMGISQAVKGKSAVLAHTQEQVTYSPSSGKK